MEENQAREVSVIEERAKQLLTILESPFNDSSIIQDNKNMYLVDGDVYRCRMPSQLERSLAEDKRNKLYLKLLEAGEYKTRKQLKKLLKDRQGLDIDELEIEKEDINTKTKDAYLALAMKKTEDTLGIKEFKDKIEDLRLEYFKIGLEISNYLSASIEDQLEQEYIQYLTYACTEKPEADKEDSWVKVWKSLDEFKNDTTKVSTLAINRLVALLINTRD